MAENTFLIRSGVRTIFVDMDGTVYKYKLNLPEFYVKRHVSMIDFKTRWNMSVICEGKHCYVPLLNVNEAGNICLGRNIIKEEEFVNALFCTKFTLDIVSSMRYYVNLPDIRDDFYNKIASEKINKFYKECEKTGTIKLKEFK